MNMYKSVNGYITCAGALMQAPKTVVLSLSNAATL